MRGLLLSLPAFAALGLFALTAEIALPGRWPAALLTADTSDIPALIFHLTAAPRLITAALAGAVLALAGALMQRIFLNPIAEPATLGITAGAQCALTLSLLYVPALSPHLQPLIALTGALLALALVLILAARPGLSSLSLILSGLVVTTLLGGVNAVMVLFHHEVLQSLFLWQAGSLEQEGWGNAAWLAGLLALALMLAPVANRPLALLGLGDQSARMLGLAPATWRGVIAIGAVALAAIVTALTGVFAFLGILAPLLARAILGREPGLTRIALTGAGLLMLTDQLSLALRPVITLQTGSLLALSGALLLLPLLRRAVMPAPATLLPQTPARPLPRLALPVALALLCLLPLLALGLGRSPEGWAFSLMPMLEWRLPRVTGAAVAGGAFGLAGILLQRLTANPLAGPELLGVSGAAALGLIFATLVAGGALSGDARLFLYGATALGALAGVLLVLALAARLRFSPEGLLLAGLAISLLFSAVMAVLLVSGHPLAGQLLGWLSGSTYRIALPDAVLALSALALLTGAAMAISRWLDILPLGAEAAQSLGLPLTPARAAVVLLAALATASGTLLTGPAGFIGLIAPALARLAAPPRALMQIPLSTLAGAALMVLADWLGRILAFPWQIPAGMMALLTGGVFLIFLLMRRAR